MRQTSLSLNAPPDCILSALRTDRRPTFHVDAPEIGFVDLFAGGGLLSAGADIAGQDLGFKPRHIAFVEWEKHQTATYRHNYPAAKPYHDVTQVAGGAIGSPPTPASADKESEQEFVDYVNAHRPNHLVLMGGPPCQGHSNLNNHTRNSDDKNELYMTMARAAKLLRPDMVVIENVPDAIKDKKEVVQRTEEALSAMGYQVAKRAIVATRFGSAQARERLFMVAVRGQTQFSFEEMDATLGIGQERPVMWAIDDLADADQTDPVLAGKNQTGKHRPGIDWLFDNNKYDLPFHLRSAKSHQNGSTYKEGYGRMHPDRPSPTLFTGFSCSGRGRFVHPTRRRTLSPREGLRLQTVPDWFEFPVDVPMTSMYEIVGNGAPALFSSSILTQAIRQGFLPADPTLTIR